MSLRDKVIYCIFIILILSGIVLTILLEGEVITLPPFKVVVPAETMSKDLGNPYEPPILPLEEPVETDPVIETIPETTEEPIIQPIFTYDIYDIVCLAKLIQGEGGGLSKLEKSAIVWCALNYLDSGKWEHTIIEVVKSPNRFTGFSEDCKVTTENLWVANDVLERYTRELNGETEVGRTLPKDYICFRGFKWKEKAVEFGLTKPTYSHNWFFTVAEYRKEKFERKYWDWSLPNPYKD